jgi:ornithine cyclodeaminase/alanine dehydrogenase
VTLVLDNDDVVSAVDMPRLIDRLEEALRLDAAGGVQMPPRINLDAGQRGFFRVMPAVIAGMDVMGLKAFNGTPDGTVRYVIALWSVSSGELIALVDASYLTAARTGAVTGVAQRAIAGRGGATEVGVIGSGLEARTNLEAICAVADVRSAKVFSPTAGRRELFAREMSERIGIDVAAVASAREAADAPTVLVATNTGAGSGVVALESAWLESARHVNTIGSTMPILREVDGALFGRADLVVLDTPHAAGESGDLQAAAAEGHWDDAKVRLLSDVVATGAPAANGGPSLTVFKSVGTALQDLVAAKAVHEVAVERGLGRELDFLAEKVF